jgi:hypothetical protein
MPALLMQGPAVGVEVALFRLETVLLVMMAVLFSSSRSFAAMCAKSNNSASRRAPAPTTGRGAGH